jgi:hypothetical protein
LNLGLIFSFGHYEVGIVESLSALGAYPFPYIKTEVQIELAVACVRSAKFFVLTKCRCVF